MNIGFFGTYFIFFEDIIYNCSKELHNNKFFLFIDKKSYSILFKNINTSYVNLQIKTDFNYAIPDEKILNFFNCDDDRLEEFNLKKPSLIQLRQSARLIINSFIVWKKKVKPEILICEGPNNFFNNVIIDYLKSQNENYYSFCGGRISKSTCLKKNGNLIFNKKTNNYISHEKDYMKNSYPKMRNIFGKIKDFKATSLYRDIKVIFRNFNLIKKEDLLLPYSGNRIDWLIRTRILFLKKSILNLFILRLKQKDFKDNNYLVYPEHFRPEAATSAHENKFINDIKNCIYIKEMIEIPLVFRFHPAYFTKRPILNLFKLLRMFKQDISMPNQSLEKLIINSSGIITISSSVAIDSMRFGKPVIILGSPEFIKNSELLSENVLLIRKDNDFSKIKEYIKNFKKLSTKSLDIELQKIYHPYSIAEGQWIRVIVDLHK